MIKDIPQLVDAEVISQATADRIIDYYQNKKSNSTNRLFAVFGILGAILVGLGSILLVAHNWDELSRTIKSIFAFFPLVIGQLLCVFSLVKRQESTAWREGTAVFLIFAVGASIALVSQIYNMPGSMTTYLLTWMLLTIPLIYVLNSSVTSLLCIIGITYYAFTSNHLPQLSGETNYYWILLIAIIPHYYMLLMRRPQSNSTNLHNWLIPLSVMVAFGRVIKMEWELMIVAYYCLFSLLYFIGNLRFFKSHKLRNNGYKILGFVGSIVLLFILSFDWVWDKLRDDYSLSSSGMLVIILITMLALGGIVVRLRTKSLREIKPISLMFIPFLITFVIGLELPVSVLLINVIVFVIGILTIMDGARQINLGVLNTGLLIISILIACRFFDTDISFVTGGLLFVSVGIGFFVTNYWMLKKRKLDEQY